MTDEDREFIEEQFRKYIERRRYIQFSRYSSADDLWYPGEIAEAEAWLKHFGVDISYERIQPIVEGKAPMSAF